MVKTKNQTLETESVSVTPSSEQPSGQKGREDSSAQQQFPPGDSLNDCVALCQEQRWREALALCRRLYERAEKNNDAEMLTSLENARVKIEYSLRRQMSASLIAASKQLLEKEFLLDVSE